MKAKNRYIVIILLFFSSLSLESCWLEDFSLFGFSDENFRKVSILYFATHVSDKISFIENSSVTMAWHDSVPFFSSGGTTYSSTISSNGQLRGDSNYITITISNPHVQVYNETSSDIDIQYSNGTPFFRIVPTRPFTLEITRWDSRAVGTFSGTLEHRFDNTNTVNIAEGSFDILIQ